MRNKALLIQTIQNDCQIRHLYWKDGQTCAIGALALQAGVSEGFLKAAGKQAIWWAQTMEVNEMRHAIMHHFDLVEHTLNQIQAINDKYETPEKRRAAILEYIETISPSPK